MKPDKVFYLLFVCFITAFVSGCGTYVPETVQEPPDERAQKMVEEAWRYYDYWPATNYCWLVRTSASDTDGAMYWEGVAYSYGNKDTPEHFKQKLDAQGVINHWYEYTVYKVGLFDSEINWSDPKYMPTKWAGVDCSGLVQRCAYAGGFRFSGVPYEGNIGNGYFNSFGGEINSQDFNKYFSRLIADNYTLSGTIESVLEGDIVIYDPPYKHVAVVSDVYIDYYDPSNSEVYIINALGDFGYGYQVVRCKIREPAPIFKIYRWPK